MTSTGNPRSTGPKVVALGGGHGLSASLRAARRYASQITAIVSVADDGGSSGRLREAFGMAAPGDVRRCLVALASDEDSLWARAFEQRFSAGELRGHPLGNLVIAGLAEATGDFMAATHEAGRLLDVVGTVLPATSVPVMLKAVAEGGWVEGQVRVSEAGRISLVALVPPDPVPAAGAVEAIAEADQILIGPGSLFTSVLAALAVPALREAVAGARGQRVYVCNLREQAGETAGYDVAAHVHALLAHGVEPHVVLHDPAALPVGDVPVPAAARTVARDDHTGHDPGRLATALADLLA